MASFEKGLKKQKVEPEQTALEAATLDFEALAFKAPSSVVHGGDNVVQLRCSRPNRLRTLYGRFWKGLLDWALGALILVLAAPLLIALAVGVKLSSPGPVLFTQRRQGLDGKEFRIFKFRTMIYHTEADGAVTPALREDARVTRFGAFLRRTSLDELPQLLNVIRGEMSLVGPRPHAVEHGVYFQERIAAYSDRLSVKPGMTGWAQVHGFRGSIESLDSMRARLAHDQWYIRQWSPALDVKILWRTLFNLGHPNAY